MNLNTNKYPPKVYFIYISQNNNHEILTVVSNNNFKMTELIYLIIYKFEMVSTFLYTPYSMQNHQASHFNFYSIAFKLSNA